jgi:Skp family chaperone for outer membrane proteins
MNTIFAKLGASLYLTLMLALAPQYAFAVNLVVLDLNRLYDASDAGKSAATQVESQRDKLQELVTSWESQLKLEEEQLRNQKPILDAKIFRERLRQFEVRTVQVQRDVNAINTKIGELRDIGKRQIASVIRSILETKSVEMGFDVAIDQSIPLFASEAVDITESVMTLLNSKIQTVDLPIIKIEQRAVPITP